MEKEIWKSVIATEDKYIISNMGRIKNVNLDKILKISKNQNGGRFTSIKLNNKQKSVTIHIEVAKAFMGYDKQKHILKFKDGDKDNLKLDNLVITDRSKEIKDYKADEMIVINDYRILELYKALKESGREKIDLKTLMHLQSISEGFIAKVKSGYCDINDLKRRSDEKVIRIGKDKRIVH